MKTRPWLGLVVLSILLAFALSVSAQRAPAETGAALSYSPGSARVARAPAAAALAQATTTATLFIPRSWSYVPLALRAPSAWPVVTPTLTVTPTATSAATPTITPTPSRTATATKTLTPSKTPTVTKTPTATKTATATKPPTNTATPSATPTRSPTPTVPCEEAKAGYWTGSMSSSFTVLNTSKVRGLKLTVPFDQGTCTYRIPSDVPIGLTGWYPSLAVDAAGIAHIAYTSSETGGLYYARWDGAGWAITEVERGHVSCADVSLALDLNGRPHISYYELMRHVLRHVWFDGSAWQMETVDDAGDVGRECSIAVDGQGHPSISYYDAGYQSLMCAQFDGSTWDIEEVDGSGIVGRYSSIALDKEGYPHISYLDVTELRLKYAWEDVSGWHSEVADGAFLVGAYTSLALDASGKPHIAYLDMWNDDIRYATKGASAWTKLVADSQAEWGNMGIAVDDTGRVHIGFTAMNGNVRYTTYKGTAWAATTVHALANPSGGAFADLALDPAGTPRMAYYDETEGDLRYAVRVGGPWRHELVDAICGRGFAIVAEGIGVGGVFRPSTVLDGLYGTISCGSTRGDYEGDWSATWNRLAQAADEADGRPSAVTASPSLAAWRGLLEHSMWEQRLELNRLRGVP